MNMNKALQNLYHAVSGSTTTKVNISKLLVDIHYAITGKGSPNKNNWAKIINSMADNWPGGGGSSDFSTAQVTLNMTPPEGVPIAHMTVDSYINFAITADIANRGYDNASTKVTDNKAEILLYQGIGYIVGVNGADEEWTYVAISDDENATLSGNIQWDSSIGDYGAFVVTGDCTITADFIAD